MSRIDTGVKKKTLISLAHKLNKVPESFALNPKLEGLLQKRLQAVERRVRQLIGPMRRRWPLPLC